jgi:hypothetical protein
MKAHLRLRPPVLVALLVVGAPLIGAVAHSRNGRPVVPRGGSADLDAARAVTHHVHRALPVDVPTLL